MAGPLRPISVKPSDLIGQLIGKNKCPRPDLAGQEQVFTRAPYNQDELLLALI